MATYLQHLKNIEVLVNYYEASIDSVRLTLLLF